MKTNRHGSDGGTTPQRRFRSHGGRAAQQAFTLLEVLSVLMIISILATVVGVHVINRLREEARRAERTTLANLSDGLKSRIRKARQVPAAADLPQFLATELEVPVDRVRRNAQGYDRAFVFDPAFRLGADTNSAPPFVQGSAGSVEPLSPRVLIVSRLDQSLPETLAFDTLWSLVEGTVPGGWTGEAQDLLVQRCDLRSLFHRVILANTHASTNGPYEIGAAPLSSVEPRGRVEKWFIDGTPIGFYASATRLQARDFLREDISYTFEVAGVPGEGRWNRHATGVSPGWQADPEGEAFADLASRFLAASARPDALYQTTQQAAMDEFYNYFQSVADWAAGDLAKGIPPFYVAGASDNPQAPLHVIAWDAQSRLARFSRYLVH